MQWRRLEALAVSDGLPSKKLQGRDSKAVQLCPLEKDTDEDQSYKDVVENNAPLCL